MMIVAAILLVLSQVSIRSCRTRHAVSLLHDGDSSELTLVSPHKAPSIAQLIPILEGLDPPEAKISKLKNLIPIYDELNRWRLNNKKRLVEIMPYKKESKPLAFILPGSKHYLKKYKKQNGSDSDSDKTRLASGSSDNKNKEEASNKHTKPHLPITKQLAHENVLHILKNKQKTHKSDKHKTNESHNIANHAAPKTNDKQNSLLETNNSPSNIAYHTIHDLESHAVNNNINSDSREFKSHSDEPEPASNILNSEPDDYNFDSKVQDLHFTKNGFIHSDSGVQDSETNESQSASMSNENNYGSNVKDSESDELELHSNVQDLEPQEPDFGLNVEVSESSESESSKKSSESNYDSNSNESESGSNEQDSETNGSDNNHLLFNIDDSDSGYSSPKSNEVNSDYNYVSSAHNFLTEPNKPVLESILPYINLDTSKSNLKSNSTSDSSKPDDESNKYYDYNSLFNETNVLPNYDINSDFKISESNLEFIDSASALNAILSNESYVESDSHLKLNDFDSEPESTEFAFKSQSSQSSMDSSESFEKATPTVQKHHEYHGDSNAPHETTVDTGHFSEYFENDVHTSIVNSTQKGTQSNDKMDDIDSNYYNNEPDDTDSPVDARHMVNRLHDNYDDNEEFLVANTNLVKEHPKNPYLKHLHATTGHLPNKHDGNYDKLTTSDNAVVSSSHITKHHGKYVDSAEKDEPVVATMPANKLNDEVNNSDESVGDGDESYDTDVPDETNDSTAVRHMENKHHRVHYENKLSAAATHITKPYHDKDDNTNNDDESNNDNGSNDDTGSNLWNDDTGSNLWNDDTESNLWNGDTESNIWNDDTKSTIWNDGTNTNLWNDVTESKLGNDDTESNLWNDETESNLWNDYTESNLRNDDTESNLWNGDHVSLNAFEVPAAHVINKNQNKYDSESNSDVDSSEDNDFDDDGDKKSKKTDKLSTTRPTTTEHRQPELCKDHNVPTKFKRQKKKYFLSFKLNVQ